LFLLFLSDWRAMAQALYVEVLSGSQNRQPDNEMPQKAARM
jgi:hypothetical protein